MIDTLEVFFFFFFFWGGGILGEVLKSDTLLYIFVHV